MVPHPILGLPQRNYGNLHAQYALEKWKLQLFVGPTTRVLNMCKHYTSYCNIWGYLLYWRSTLDTHVEKQYMMARYNWPWSGHWSWLLQLSCKSIAWCDTSLHLWVWNIDLIHRLLGIHWSCRCSSRIQQRFVFLAQGSICSSILGIMRAVLNPDDVIDQLLKWP